MGLLARAGLVMGLAMCAASPAWAIKVFPQVEDGYAEAKGQLEYENTFIVGHAIKGDSKYTNFSNESELEYGVSENFTFRVKGAMFYENPKDSPAGLHFDDGGVEAQYYFTNPNIDSIGVSVITSALFGEGTFASENFLVIQKDWEKWVVAYNLGLTVELDGFAQGGSQDTSLALSNSIGVAYSLTRDIRIGFDIAQETGIHEFFRHKEDTTIYTGPMINWVPTENFWLTVGVEYELLKETDDAPRYQLSIICGYYF